jgi:methylated-DNA-[protein]-cysteine S-methyltransferase
MLEKHYYFKLISSPVGQLKLIATEKALCAVLFNAGRGSRTEFDGDMERSDNHPVLVQTEKQLSEYFSGKRKDFNLPLDATGTVFQMKAWKELCKIPYGKTISYGQQAKGVGDAKKARAVGMANGRNPLSIVVPCHRVIGASGSLTGFGGGLKVKEYLIDLEKKNAA